MIFHIKLEYQYCPSPTGFFSCEGHTLLVRVIIFPLVSANRPSNNWAPKPKTGPLFSGRRVLSNYKLEDYYEEFPTVAQNADSNDVHITLSIGMKTSDMRSLRSRHTLLRSGLETKTKIGCLGKRRPRKRKTGRPRKERPRKRKDLRAKTPGGDSSYERSGDARRKF